MIDKKEIALTIKADLACSRYMADLFDTRKENAYLRAQKRLRDYQASKKQTSTTTA